jgi:hypothetical protein
MLWTHQAFSVAACIVIYFDILHSSSSTQDGASLVEKTIEHLQLCRQKSMIAARGVKVLNALQKQIAVRAQSRKSPIENTKYQNPRKRRRGFDAVDFARSFCDGENDPSVSSQIQEQQNPTPELNSWSQQIPENPQVSSVDEPLILSADLTWIWKTPVNDDDGTRTFDSLLSFANQGVGH